MSNLTHFVLNHFGPASTTVQGDPFLVKELLNAVDLEFSECFRMHHPDNEKNLLVIRAFSHGNSVERMKNRKKTGLNREVQAVHYPCISVTRGARVEGFVEVRAIGSEEGESSRVSPVARDKSRAVSTALNDCKSNRKSSKNPDKEIQTKMHRRRLLQICSSRRSLHWAWSQAQEVRGRELHKLFYSRREMRQAWCQLKRKRSSVDDCEKHTHTVEGCARNTSIEWAMNPL